MEYLSHSSSRLKAIIDVHSPVSTMYTITGAIVGVGSVQDVQGVRGVITFNLLIARILAIPARGRIAAVRLAAANPKRRSAWRIAVCRCGCPARSRRLVSRHAANLPGRGGLCRSPA